MHGIKKVVKMPEVWLVAALVFTTYAAFSGLAFLTPYVTEIFGMSVSLRSIYRNNKKLCNYDACSTYIRDYCR